MHALLVSSKIFALMICIWANDDIKINILRRKLTAENTQQVVMEIVSLEPFY